MNKMSKKFNDDFQTLYGVEPEYHSAGGYGCGQVLQQAVEATGSLDNHKLRQAVLKTAFPLNPGNEVSNGAQPQPGSNTADSHGN